MIKFNKNEKILIEPTISSVHFGDSCGNCGNNLESVYIGQNEYSKRLAGLACGHCKDEIEGVYATELEHACRDVYQSWYDFWTYEVSAYSKQEILNMTDEERLSIFGEFIEEKKAEAEEEYCL